MGVVVSAVLLAVAKELAQTAKDSLPELRDGEKVLREWYTDGVYYRKTAFNNETFIRQYDFRQRESTSHKEDMMPMKRQRKSA